MTICGIKYNEYVIMWIMVSYLLTPSEAYFDIDPMPIDQQYLLYSNCDLLVHLSAIGNKGAITK